MGLFIPRELNQLADALSRAAPADHKAVVTGSMEALLAAGAATPQPPAQLQTTSPQPLRVAVTGPFTRRLDG